MRARVCVINRVRNSVRSDTRVTDVYTTHDTYASSGNETERAVARTMADTARGIHLYNVWYPRS